MPTVQAHDLRCAGRVVARYVWDPQLPATVSPRPYLHPVTTLAGTTVTGFMPDDHRHHLGASIAVPTLNTANFWGGRTWIPGRGSTHLDNHGRQGHQRWLHRADDRVEQELLWTARDGRALAHEHRVLAVEQLSLDAWVLHVAFALTSATGDALTIASPGANGRAGAGYGGFFWRAPAGPAGVRAFGGDSDHDVHGSRDPWIVLSGGHPPWTLIFLAGPATDPWFVRSDDYAGVCAAIAWDSPLTIAAGEVFARELRIIIADGPATPETIAAATARTSG
ncbi:DUF6807 domain-containing protein [Actinoplanes derwentensis]|uniref:Methane oxygenase PmoA n=1 Tax=Actinoplanes derwentensis TaxID=113562 RepID=A0A1H2DBL0_9ACTN|nr:PmoA family protein [Actinoplanes derwentensis]GID87546.1 oxidoreductase [Actinoplanes derwentensis]SDT80113.1 Methane oxygenase PmoA [Actinoplanes derwentensis]